MGDVYGRSYHYWWGSRGVAAALRASQLGGKVILIEEKESGGVCVNRGCIPTKIFLESADLLYQAKQSENYGIVFGEVNFSLGKLVEKKQALVSEVRSATEDLLRTNGVEIIRGSGKIWTPNEVRINGQQLTGRNILIATGSVPSKPDVKGIDEEGVISSEEALDLEEVPSRLLILGADPVGLELASIFNRFGASVAVIEMGPRILPDEDHETGQRLSLILRRSGAAIEAGADLDLIEKGKQGLVATLD